MDALVGTDSETDDIGRKRIEYWEEKAAFERYSGDLSTARYYQQQANQVRRIYQKAALKALFSSFIRAIVGKS